MAAKGRSINLPEAQGEASSRREAFWSCGRKTVDAYPRSYERGYDSLKLARIAPAG